MNFSCPKKELSKKRINITDSINEVNKLVVNTTGKIHIYISNTFIFTYFVLIFTVDRNSMNVEVPSPSYICHLMLRYG